MANSYLTRSLASTNTSWTFSAWVKRSGISEGSIYLTSWGSNGVDATGIGFNNDDELFYYSEDGGSNRQRKTSAKYRDVNGWYHVVVKSSSNAITLYVNGEEPTQSWVSGSAGQALDTSTMAIGKWVTSNYYFNGYMSHVAFVDGQALAPTVFGQTDSTSGIWKFKSPTGVTWGTNGFHLKMENSGALGTDSSGNTNTFTVNGNLKQALDTPSNVHCTLNRLYRTNEYSLTNGNNTFTNASSGNHRMTAGTLAASSGKWYAEVKVTAVGGNYPQIGIINPNLYKVNADFGDTGRGYSYLSNGQKKYNNSVTSYGNSYTTGDIIGIAMDLDNNKLYFSKNGTFENSGVPTSGSTGTGAAFSTVADTFYTFGQTAYSTSSVYDWNFGNGFFGTTAITSAGSNGNGSLFEYDVPSGYYALNTKNINTYG